MQVSRHLWNHVPCVIEMTTTGTNPMSSQPIHVIAARLTSTFDLSNLPIFDCYIHTEGSARQLKMGALEYDRFKQTAVDVDVFVKVFEWWCKSHLKCKSSGRPRKLIPVSWDWNRISPLLRTTLGNNTFESIFHDLHRSVLPITSYLNDRMDSRNQDYPFMLPLPKWVAIKLGVPWQRETGKYLGLQVINTVKMYKHLLYQEMGMPYSKLPNMDQELKDPIDLELLKFQAENHFEQLETTYEQENAGQFHEDESWEVQGTDEESSE